MFLSTHQKDSFENNVLKSNVDSKEFPIMRLGDSCEIEVSLITQIAAAVLLPLWFLGAIFFWYTQREKELIPLIDENTSQIIDSFSNLNERHTELTPREEEDQNFPFKDEVEYNRQIEKNLRILIERCLLPTPSRTLSFLEVFKMPFVGTPDNQTLEKPYDFAPLHDSIEKYFTLVPNQDSLAQNKEKWNYVGNGTVKVSSKTNFSKMKEEISELFERHAEF